MSSSSSKVYMTDAAMIVNLRLQAANMADNQSYHTGSSPKKEDTLPWQAAERLEQLLKEREFYYNER
jgi:hypothetical protein